MGWALLSLEIVINEKWLENRSSSLAILGPSLSLFPYTNVTKEKIF